MLCFDLFFDDFLVAVCSLIRFLNDFGDLLLGIDYCVELVSLNHLLFQNERSVLPPQFFFDGRFRYEGLQTFLVNLVLFAIGCLVIFDSALSKMGNTR